MRALYLFLGEILANDQRRNGPGGGTAGAGNDDADLRPIRPGAFARWMHACDRAASQARAPMVPRQRVFLL
jgi:hypothetical protein